MLNICIFVQAQIDKKNIKILSHYQKDMKKPSFITILFISIFGIVSTFLTSCSNKSSDTIRIGILDGPSAVSFIQLIDYSPIIGGKNVEIIIKSEPLQIQALMMQGELDFAILPTIMAANLYNKGLKYRMVACPIWGTLYLMTNLPIQHIENLKGQTIAIFGQGATSDILLRRMIKEKVILNTKIDYSFASNNEIAQALLFKKVKLAVVSEPLVSKLLAQDSSIHIIEKLDCKKSIYNSDKDIFVQTAFLVSQRFTEDYPELVQQVCQSYSNSCNFISEQPEKAAKLMVKHKLATNIESARRSIPFCNIRYVGAFALENEVNRYLDIFYEYNPKSIGGKIPNNDFIFQTY